MKEIKAKYHKGIFYPVEKVEYPIHDHEHIQLEIVQSDVLSEDKRRNGIRQLLDELRRSRTFSEMDNPAEWQRLIRSERELPYR